MTEEGKMKKERKINGERKGVMNSQEKKRLKKLSNIISEKN